MNTPPGSISSTQSPPPGYNSKKRRHLHSSSDQTMSSSSIHRVHMGPPSPASAVPSTASVIAVGSGDEEAMYAAAGVQIQLSNQPTNSADSGLGPSELIPNRDESGHTGEPMDYEMEGYPESIASSLRNHIYEGGLRYHAYRDGKYAFPNDDVEQNRDDMKHTMTLMLLKQKYFCAPVEQMMRTGCHVVDLGTGTGIWCTELGEKYPNTTFHGIDLSPIQPNMVTDNVYFELDDFEDDWMFPDNKFDYVHIRHTLHSIKDRKALLKRIFQHLKPGGYVEFQELHYFPHCDDQSCTLDAPYAFRDFMNYLSEGLRALGSELNGILKVPQEIREAGFVEVKSTTKKSPIGVWPRDRDLRYAGLFLRTAIMDGLRGLVKRPFGTGLGWTQLQIEIFLMDVRKAVMNSDFHAYFPLHIVYARKPVA